MTFIPWKYCSSSRKSHENENQNNLQKSTLTYATFVQPQIKGINDEKLLYGSNNQTEEIKETQSHTSNSTRSVTEASICEFAHLPYDEDFESVFAPRQMRYLALIAHNHMKSAMIEFVLTNKNLLKKFRLTGTNTTMKMLREVYRDDPNVVYGPTCSSGPLGGDAEIVAMMCNGQLGGVIFFVDPMSAHPHAADIECLTRQIIVHNIFFMNNPVSANAGTYILQKALTEGKSELIPSFFRTLESPSVREYKKTQREVSKTSMQIMDSSMHFENF